MGTVFTVLAVLAVVIWIVDRVLLWFELRGWISYRRMPRVRHSYGNAVLGIDALLQPGRQHFIEMEVAGQDYREDDDEAERLKKGLLSAVASAKADKLSLSNDRDRDRAGAGRPADRRGP